MGTYLADPFTDTNGTVLSSHTIPTKRGSQAWVYSDFFGGSGGSGSNTTIQSNQCQFAASFSAWTVDLGVTDYVIEFDWVISSTSGHRLAIPVRWQDNQNHYVVNVREPTDGWNIYKYVAGVQSSVASGSYTFNTSTTYAIKIVVSGTSVTLYVNGASQGSATMDAYTSTTRCGIGSASITTNTHIDNLVITNGVTPAVTVGSIDPEVNLAMTFTGFVAAPTTITYKSVSEAFTGTTTTSAGTMLAIPLTDFAPSQSHVNTRWQTNYTLTVSDGIDSASDTTVMVDPTLSAGEDLGVKSGTTQYNDYVTWPAAAATSDETFGYWSDGDGVRDQTISGTIESGTGYFAAVTLPAKGHLMVYDISAGAWLARADTVLYEAPSASSAVSAIVTSPVMAVAISLPMGIPA
jgi:hypothetical protein